MNDKKEEQPVNDAEIIKEDQLKTENDSAENAENSETDTKNEDEAIQPVVIVKEAGEEKEEEEVVSTKRAVGVRLRRTAPLMAFWDNKLELKEGMEVIVEAERGLALGRVVTLEPCQKFLKQNPPEMRVVRIADKRDQLIKEENEKRNKEGHKICLKYIEELNLPMKLIEVEYQHSANKAIFYFSADGRVDFRELVKLMAQELKIRVEMRQIGIRDEARLVGGIGPCGQTVCCSTFLVDFLPVSIRQAKEQNLTLNPEKVSGLCGRLMCCLGYESSVYKDMQSGLPKIGKKADTWLGKGRVLEINIFSKIMRLELENREYVSVNIDDFKAWKQDPDKFAKVLQQREQDERENAIDNAVSKFKKDTNNNVNKDDNNTNQDRNSRGSTRKVYSNNNQQKPDNNKEKSGGDNDKQNNQKQDEKQYSKRNPRGNRGKRRGKPGGKPGGKPYNKQKQNGPSDSRKPAQKQGKPAANKPADNQNQSGNAAQNNEQKGDTPKSAPDPIRRRKLNTDKNKNNKRKYNRKPYKGKKTQGGPPQKQGKPKPSPKSNSNAKPGDNKTESK